MAYVYFHINPLKNQVFYVGIGIKRRAYSKNGRSEHWKEVVSKYGYIVDIVENNLTWEQAQEREKWYIKRFGRSDLGKGNLTNQTDGGDGGLGRIVYNESREKSRIKMKGRTHSDETKRLISEKGKGRVVTDGQRIKIANSLRGRKRPPEIGIKISLARKGKPSPLKGRTLTQEQKDRLSIIHRSKKGTNTGKKLSEEWKHNISEGWRKRKERLITNKLTIR